MRPVFPTAINSILLKVLSCRWSDPFLCSLRVLPKAKRFTWNLNFSKLLIRTRLPYFSGLHLTKIDLSEFELGVNCPSLDHVSCAWRLAILILGGIHLRCKKMRLLGICSSNQAPIIHYPEANPSESVLSVSAKY